MGAAYIYVFRINMLHGIHQWELICRECIVLLRATGRDQGYTDQRVLNCRVCVLGVYWFHLLGIYRAGSILLPQVVS